MTDMVIYFVVILGLGLICVIIGFISGPNRFGKKPVPVPVVPAGNRGGEYSNANYQIEKQIFFNELNDRVMEKKPNNGEDYLKERERRDVIAFSGYCAAGLFKNVATGDSGQ
jgi:hypothetical protein